MKKILISTLSVVWILVVQLCFPRVGETADKNGLCLTEPEFTDFNTMDVAAVRTWLDGLGGFLRGTSDGTNPYTFIDLDGNPTDPAQEISNAARANKINPRVLLTTLRKEKPRVFRDPEQPTDNTLRLLAGCGGPTTAKKQIQCVAEQLRRDFDRLTQCRPTGPLSLPDPNRWQVDVVRLAGDAPGDETDAFGESCPVQPASKTAAALLAYTPWAGAAFGCGQAPVTVLPGEEPPPLVGGNGLFCAFWRQHRWDAPPGPLALSPQPLLMNCAPETSRCVSINASGGTTGANGYSWSVSNPDAPITVTGVNKQNVQLKPPVNNPNAGGGEAYKLTIIRTDAGHVSFERHSCTQKCYTYDCNDVFLVDSCLVSGPRPSCTTPTDPALHCVENLGPGHIGHDGSDPCPRPVSQNNTCLPNVMTWATQRGVVCDTRTLAQKNDGCRPCRLEMQGATVTVTDAAGASSSATVTAQ